jgi:glutamate/aspartate transport system substrate-binding protein
MRISGLVLGLTLAGWAGLGAARADDLVLSGTLKAIQDRGTILIGYREKSVPFSFLNRGGQPVGFSMDICHGIAADVAKRLDTDLVEADAPAWQKGTRIVYVPVASDARLPKVISGAIDLECGSTTANDERAKTVAFSPTFFLAGTKIMARSAPSDGKVVSSYRDLAGRKLGVAVGTTTDVVVKRLATKTSPPIEIVEQPGVDDAYSFLVAGAVDAIASDDILLSGLLASRPDGRDFAVVGDYLSYEPYAIMFRKDDPAFADLVRTSFEGMAADNVLGSRYRRWFMEKLPDGKVLDLPISAQLSEMYRALGQTD